MKKMPIFYGFTITALGLAIGSLHTADTSKVGRPIDGEPAARILREQRRIPKFDAPNLELSKVYKSCFNYEYLI